MSDNLSYEELRNRVNELPPEEKKDRHGNAGGGGY